MFNTSKAPGTSLPGGDEPHPILVKSALEAVWQWRYRPYLLNSEPIEVETDVT